MLTPYQKRARDRFEGPRSIGKCLRLREDFYAYSYLHELKRDTLFNNGKDSDEEIDEKVEAVGEAMREKVAENLGGFAGLQAIVAAQGNPVGPLGEDGGEEEK